MNKSIQPLQIINHSELAPHWNWLADRFPSAHYAWSHVSTRDSNYLNRLPVISAYPKRVYAGFRAAQRAAGNPRSLLISHGPRPTFFAAAMDRRRSDQSIKHLAYSFNFTNLPTGFRRQAMCRAFNNVDKFVVFSSMEKRLYADYFGIDPARIDFLHWAVKPPEVLAPDLDLRETDYVCAVGSQGRDYATLLAAAKRLPHIPFRLVIHPFNLAGLDVPSNVHIHASITNQRAMDIIQSAKFMVLPLINARIPCGHVTAVAAMHLGKMVIATDSSGLHDYLRDGETAMLVPPQDPQALATLIEEAWWSHEKTNLIAGAGQLFAQTWCHEDRVVDYFQKILASYEAAQGD